ncbi:MAG TPA: four helix bundle protein [Cytophagales bacterium]|nr:four helix bundle protein [Cytophagales bacterium]
MITTLEDFKIYNQAMVLGEQVWNLVDTWKYFEKDTIGKQLVKSADSISANLSEGLGRYHFKETRNFSYFARGSLFETKTWLTKAFNHNLIEEQQFNSLTNELDLLGKRINAYINTLGPTPPNS